MRLLVAEDDPTFATLLRHTLGHQGFEVTVVQDGQAAWEALQSGGYDLFVSDYQMPGVHGGELCRRIRRDPRLATLPIIIITAKQLELDVNRLCQEYGIQFVFGKPFSPRRLVAAVQAELGLAAFQESPN